MKEPLPFAGLLAHLRLHGVEVGVRDHLALGRLLARWDGTSPAELGDAVARILGRSASEVASISSVCAGYLGAPDTRPAPPPRRDPWPGLLLLAAGAIVVLVAVTVAVGADQAVRERELPPAPSAAEGAPPSEATSSPSPSAPPPSVAPPSLGAAVWDEILHLWPLEVGATLVLAATLAAWRRLREERARAAEARRSAEAANLAGPPDYSLPADALAPWIPREDLAEAAALLARATSPEEARHALDVPRTVRASLRTPGRPVVVHQRRTAQLPVLILEDGGRGMEPWALRTDQVLGALDREGVPLERWRLGAGEMVHSGSASTTLAQVLTRRPEAPLLVVSDGPRSAEDAPGDGAPAWVTEVLQHGRRAWLHPSDDPNPADLAHFPERPFPLDGPGLVAAASSLAAAAGASAGRPRDEARAQVTDSDRAAMRDLLTLLPSPNASIGELLRQRFLPRAPQAVVVQALQATGDPGARAPASPEAVAAVDAAYAAVRAPVGSLAAARLELDHALFVLRHLPARVDEAVARLVALAGGPLADDVRRGVRGLPRSKAIRHARRATDRAVAQRTAATAASAPARIVWELGVTTLRIVFVALVVLGLQRPPRPVEGRLWLDAVALTVAEDDAGEGPSPGDLAADPLAGALPGEVKLAVPLRGWSFEAGEGALDLGGSQPEARGDGGVLRSLRPGPGGHLSARAAGGAWRVRLDPRHGSASATVQTSPPTGPTVAEARAGRSGRPGAPAQEAGEAGAWSTATARVLVLTVEPGGEPGLVGSPVRVEALDGTFAAAGLASSPNGAGSLTLGGTAVPISPGASFAARGSFVLDRVVLDPSGRLGLDLRGEVTSWTHAEAGATQNLVPWAGKAWVAQRWPALGLGVGVAGAALLLVRFRPRERTSPRRPLDEARLAAAALQRAVSAAGRRLRRLPEALRPGARPGAAPWWPRLLRAAVGLGLLLGCGGVLAAIALPSFVGMSRRALRSEVPGNVDGLKTAELAYDAAFDEFIGCGSREAAVRLLAGRNGKRAYDFQEAAWAACLADRLGWRPDGAVRGVYWVEAADGTFTVHGIADTDDDGAFVEYTATPSVNAKIVPGLEDVY